MDLTKLFVLVPLVLCSLVHGQDTLSIEGPDEAKSGALIRLTANLEDGESAWWIVTNPPDMDYEVVDGGKKLIFAGSCGKSEVRIILLAQKIVENRIVTRQLNHTVRVGHGAQPPPIEDPVEDPVDDDNPFERDWSELRLLVESRPEPGNDPQTARRWIEELETTATAIEGKTISDAQRMVGEARRRVFVTPKPVPWNPFFQAVDSMISSDPPKDVPEYQGLLRAIAEGMKR